VGPTIRWLGLQFNLVPLRPMAFDIEPTAILRATGCIATKPTPPELFQEVMPVKDSFGRGFETQLSDDP
jgi:hypothetical protein